MNRARVRATAAAAIAIVIVVVLAILVVRLTNESSKPKPTPAPPSGTVEQSEPAQPKPQATNPTPNVQLVCTPVVQGNYRLPDPKCTPGATAPGVTIADLCPKVNTTTVPRYVTSQTKTFVRVTYNDQNPGEIDHDIPLELGGSNGDDNLWPEDGTIPNAKDNVENHAHDAVCAGKLTLSDAQKKIATDWVGLGRQLGLNLP